MENGDGMRMVMKQRITNMWGKFKMVNLMVEEILLPLMETSMKENSRMVN